MLKKKNREQFLTTQGCDLCLKPGSWVWKTLQKREKIYVVLDILYDNFSFLATFHLSVNMGGSMGGAEDLFDLAADWVRHYYGGKGSPES